MKVVLVYNTASGSRYNLRYLRRLFAEHSITISYSFSIKQLSSRKFFELVGNGVTVAAVGGDGTLNAVARALLHTPSVLFPLPGGTFNHFVRDLGVSVDISESLAHVKKGVIKDIDVGYVNDELFLNNSNLGLYPFSLYERKQLKRFIGKHAAAALSAFDQILAFRRHHLFIDGKSLRSPFIFVGNNHYDIQASLVPQRTTITKGRLTVMVSTARTRRQLIQSILAVVRGSVSARHDFSISYRPTFEIYGKRSRLPISFDGEVKELSFPLKYRIERRSLKVLVVKARKTSL